MQKKKGVGGWGFGVWLGGIGNWGLGIAPNPHSPIPNPQSPIPNDTLKNIYSFKIKK